jgi:3-deoxy-D-manno-octulosonate 8-phosphate phosphatase (KDO 8-P phosphatase)
LERGATRTRGHRDKPDVIRALVLDVDGVLTDGGLFLDGASEMKRFSARDGVAIKLAQAGGWRVLFLSARESPAAAQRAQELGAEWATGVGNKDVFLDTWLAKAHIDWSDVAFMGDDLPDLKSMRKVGWPVAPKDAAKEVLETARYVTKVDGGKGAVRDAVEWLLDQDGKRAEALQVFMERPEGFSVGREDRGGAPR